VSIERNVDHWYPSCAQCEWVGAGSPDQRVAFQRASAHVDQEHAHRAVPSTVRGETYPPDYDLASGDVPDWITAICHVCGSPIEWDPRNLWSHADEEPAEDNPWHAGMSW